MFKNNPDVSFGDVDWSEEQLSRVFGRDIGAGNGGWPTIRFFNKQTGYSGKGYQQKDQNLQLCDELGNEDTMQQYVEEKSGASRCDVVWGENCNEMELKFLDKWIGPDKPRDQAKVEKEKSKWENAIADGMGKFAQNKQRVVLLSRLLDNYGNPEL